VAETFAAAGSLVVLLVWVYYAAQIFLLGAEFTKVYADEHGSGPGADAVASTRATSAAVEARTDAAPAAIAAGAVPHAGMRRQGLRMHDAGATSMRLDREHRVHEASARPVRQVLLLAVVTIASSAAERWRKRQRKATKRGRLDDRCGFRDSRPSPRRPRPRHGG
jgi:membrane protein